MSDGLIGFHTICRIKSSVDQLFDNPKLGSNKYKQTRMYS